MMSASKVKMRDRKMRDQPASVQYSSPSAAVGSSSQNGRQTQDSGIHTRPTVTSGVSRAAGPSVTLLFNYSTAVGFMIDIYVMSHVSDTNIICCLIHSVFKASKRPNHVTDTNQNKQSEKNQNAVCSDLFL